MPVGDFALVTHPEHQPAVDFITREGVGPFVDTGLDVRRRPRPGFPEVTERVYVSASTIKHLAQVAQVDREASELALHEAYERGRADVIEKLREGGVGDYVLALAARSR